jgi:hypothetical protein
LISFRCRMFFSSTHSPIGIPSVTANTDLSFFLDWFASARQQAAYQTRAKAEKFPCLMKSGL